MQKCAKISKDYKKKMENMENKILIFIKFYIWFCSDN
jgi:hypothetical protein